MKFIPIKIEEGGKMPSKGTEDSAGWDLYAPRNGAIYPGTTDPIYLGIKAETPKGYAFILSHRSGMHMKYQVTAYGLIDSDYRGEFIVCLTNHSGHLFEFKKGDRIAQMRLVEVPDAKLLQVDELGKTDRGEGGHGSTGS